MDLSSHLTGSGSGDSDEDSSLLVVADSSFSSDSPTVVCSGSGFETGADSSDRGSV